MLKNFSGEQATPQGIGHMCLVWIHDDSRYHKCSLKNVLYSSKFPANIFGVTKFAKVIEEPNN